MRKMPPADALILGNHGYGARHYGNAEWFMLYEWFARRCLEWNKGRNLLQVLNQTSSINNSEFDPLTSHDAAREHLAYLFANIRFDVERDFLRFVGIKSWKDLEKPIAITGRVPEIWCPSCYHRGIFNLVGSKLTLSPNNCHPNATTVQHGELRFSEYWKRWTYRMVYGYPHDSSSWKYGIDQRRKESFWSFIGRVHQFVDASLEPEDRFRIERERTWNRVYRSMNDLFWDGCTSADSEMADIAVGIKGTSMTEGRATLTPSRLATLKRWFANSRKAKP